MRAVCCLALLSVTVAAAARAATVDAPPAPVDRSFVHWDSAVEKSVRGDAFAFRHRLVEQDGRFYLEWEHAGERVRTELRDRAAPPTSAVGRLTARVSEVRVAPGERVAARLTVVAHVHGTTFTLLDQTTAANYSLGIMVSGGRIVPGVSAENHNR